MSDFSPLAYGLFGLILMALSIYLAILSLLYPWLSLRRQDRIIKLLREIAANTAKRDQPKPDTIKYRMPE